MLFRNSAIALRDTQHGVRSHHGHRPQPRAGVVVIGAGIVGNSLVHHLAQLGWRDIVQIDKGPLPNPGGSTGHASNFIFPVDHSREITDLTLDSVRQYKEMGVFTAVRRLRDRPHRGADGGAAAPDVVSAKAWGIEAELVTPGVREGEGARSSRPTSSSARSGRRAWASSTRCAPARSCASSALEPGALTVVPTVEVTGLDVEDGRITPGAHRPAATSRPSTVVIACGVWSPKIGDMAGDLASR